MKTKLRKSPRLPKFDYVGSHAYSITLVTKRRAALFTDAHLVALMRSALERAAETHGFTVLAYCFMPDRLHLLLVGERASRLSEFMRLFKQLSSYHAKRMTGETAWQTSYYDHVVRGEEDLTLVADYIWQNPVRAGLVHKRLAYPYSGPLPLPES